MNQQQVITELVKGLPTAAVALIIGLVAASIAYNQFKVARHKFRLDLFAVRYELFDVIWTVLSEFAEDPKQGIEQPLVDNIPKVYFLYGDAVGKYVESIAKMIESYRDMQREQRGAVPAVVKMPPTEEMSKWLEMLGNECDRLRERFKPYLAFDGWH